MSRPLAPPPQAIARLRRRLPVSARMRPPLLARARAACLDSTLSPLCLVTGLYEPSPGAILCQIEYGAAPAPRGLLVAPLSQLSFGRRDPFATNGAPFVAT